MLFIICCRCGDLQTVHRNQHQRTYKIAMHQILFVYRHKNAEHIRDGGAGDPSLTFINLNIENVALSPWPILTLPTVCSA